MTTEIRLAAKPCPDCQGPRPFGHKYCPPCLKRRTGPAPRYCLDCQVEVEGKRRYCPPCFHARRNLHNSTSYRQRTGAIQFCKTCGREASLDQNFGIERQCPSCAGDFKPATVSHGGTPIIRIQTTVIQPHQCGHCGGIGMVQDEDGMRCLMCERYDN